MRLARATWIAALACVAGGVRAQGEVRVISARPDSVSITIYRDFLAQVTETRTVDLPAGPVTLRFEGVIDTLLPQSAVIAGAGREVAENNYDYDPLTPGNLLRKSVGKTVTLLRTVPKSGRVSKLDATVVSTQDGLVLRSVDGHEVLRCSGLPERLVLDEIPGDLRATPTLSVKLAGGAAGKRTVQVSYIARGFGWNADYVARIAEHGRSMDLGGWISLHNFTRSSFAGAQVQLVAGRLNLIDADEGGSAELYYSPQYDSNEELEQLREQKLHELQDAADGDSVDVDVVSGCYPLGKTTDGLPAGDDIGRFPDQAPQALQRIPAMQASEEMEEVVVVRARREAERESLADYQLYRLPWATDLSANQSKQVAFLHKEAVAIERFYRVRIDAGVEDFPEEPLWVLPEVMIGWHNDAASGLGEPLPAGRVRVFEHAAGAGGSPVFAGAALLDDSPTGLPVEIAIGRALNLRVQINPVAEPGTAALVWAYLTRHIGVDFDFDILNDKPAPVVVEIRQTQDDMRLKSMRVSSSQHYERKFGDYAWRVEVPAHSSGKLTYRIKGKVPRDLE